MSSNSFRCLRSCFERACQAQLQLAQRAIDELKGFVEACSPPNLEKTLVKRLEKSIKDVFLHWFALFLASPAGGHPCPPQTLRLAKSEETQASKLWPRRKSNRPRRAWVQHGEERMHVLPCYITSLFPHDSCKNMHVHK